MSEEKKILGPGDIIRGGKYEREEIVLIEAPKTEICCRCCYNGAGDWEKTGIVYCDFDGGRSGYIDGNKCVCRVYTPYRERINDLFTKRRFIKINKEYMRILRPELYEFETELFYVMKKYKGKHNVSMASFRQDVMDIFKKMDIQWAIGKIPGLTE